jgi:hypothetical protein
VTDSDGFVGRYTDWTPYDVPKLAEFLDEDLSAAWSQARTWTQTQELVSSHRDVLRRTRDSLARAWSPERSPAARAFFAVIDELVASMDEMQDIAVTNGASLRGILTSLAAARNTVDGLHEQWKATEAVELPKGEYYDGSFKLDLNQQAQSTMRATDQAVIEYYPYLSAPTPYQPPRRADPPWTPVPADSGGSGAGGGPRGRAGPRPPAIPPVPPLARPGSSEPSPVLSGSPTGPPGGAPSGSPGSPGGSGAPLAPGATPPDPAGGSWFVATPAGRALRAGGVIGEPDPPVGRTGQARGSGVAGGASPEDGSTRAVGPVGGMLGGPVGGGTAGVRRERRRTLPSDTEWEVREGVPPVLLPPPEPTEHDPGPGVIGIDR